jgi:hypothetical protein
MALLLVADLTDVDRIGQQLVQRPAREPAPSQLDSPLGDPDFRYDFALIQFFAQLPDASQLQVSLIDVPDCLGFGRIDDQPPLANVITE